MVVKEDAAVAEYLAVVLPHFFFFFDFFTPHEMQGLAEVNAHKVAQGFLGGFFEHNHADAQPVCHVEVVGKLPRCGGFADAAARCE